MCAGELEEGKDARGGRQRTIGKRGGKVKGRREKNEGRQWLVRQIKGLA